MNNDIIIGARIISRGISLEASPEIFLAAMSSSRSDDVTKFVRPSFRSHFVLFFLLVS